MSSELTKNAIDKIPIFTAKFKTPPVKYKKIIWDSALPVDRSVIIQNTKKTGVTRHYFIKSEKSGI